jgi:hypothetical protein
VYYSKGWPVGIGSGWSHARRRSPRRPFAGVRPSPLGPARCRPPTNGTRTALERTTGWDWIYRSLASKRGRPPTEPDLSLQTPARPAVGTSTTTDYECSAPKARPSGRAIARPRRERVDHDDLVQATVDPRRGGSGDVHHRLDPAHLSENRATAARPQGRGSEKGASAAGWFIDRRSPRVPAESPAS